MRLALAMPATAAKAIAGNRGDDRLAHIRNRGRAGIDRNFIFGALIPVFSDRAEFRHVGADAEVSPRTGQNDRANRIVVGEAGKYACKFAPHAERHGVAHPRPVKADNSNTIPCGHEDIRHFPPSADVAVGGDEPCTTLSAATSLDRQQQGLRSRDRTTCISRLTSCASSSSGSRTFIRLPIKCLSSFQRTNGRRPVCPFRTLQAWGLPCDSDRSPAVGADSDVEFLFASCRRTAS